VKIVVNHLTRMQAGYICVAGINLANGQHVRPTMPGRLPVSLLARNGGPFDMAAIVDLGTALYDGSRPEVDDYRFDPLRIQQVETVSGDTFWRYLQAAARPRLSQLFGADLRAHGRGCVVAVGHGIASLGCLIPQERPLLAVDERGSVRMTLTDGVFSPNVSVTDIRLFQEDHQTPNLTLIEQVNQRMRDTSEIILSVGLGRQWQKPGDSEARHWLQVNNIHLRDQPIWQLG
jgi:hypothetical protein